MSTKVQHESKLIVLKSLNNEIEDALKNDNKWVTVIDVEGNAEIFFKYQGTNYFSILEKEVAPENLCRSLLTMVKFPRTLTINYLDLPYVDIFNETYFPQNVLDVDWISNYKNIENLRQHFLEEFPEEVFPCKDFKMCFLFRKDNVPDILHEKTVVLEICPPSEIEERIAEREAKKKENNQSQVEETKIEETKDDTKKITGEKTSSKSSVKTPIVKATKTTPAKTTTATKTPIISKTSQNTTSAKPKVTTTTSVTPKKKV